MAKSCIADCITDIQVPFGRAYVNLQDLFESEGNFSRSTSYNSRQLTTVVDGISCRQLYLRSYTFTRKKSVCEKTKKCFGKAGAKVKHTKSIIKRFQGNGDRDKSQKTNFDRRKYLRMAKDVSCAAFSSVYQRLLSCSTMAKVDVDHGN